MKKSKMKIIYLPVFLAALIVLLVATLFREDFDIRERAAYQQPKATVRPKNTPKPKKTPVPTQTNVPEITPTATPSGNETVNLILLPASSFTPNGKGDVLLSVSRNTNGYWDFLVLQTNFTGLEAGRTYQMHICGINCSSHTDARFTTNSMGSGSFSGVTITHSQWNDPVNRVVIYEYLPSGPIPTDPKACYMYSLNLDPCLRASIGF